MKGRDTITPSQLTKDNVKLSFLTTEKNCIIFILSFSLLKTNIDFNFSCKSNRIQSKIFSAELLMTLLDSRLILFKIIISVRRSVMVEILKIESKLF